MLSIDRVCIYDNGLVISFHFLGFSSTIEMLLGVELPLQLAHRTNVLNGNFRAHFLHFQHSLVLVSICPFAWRDALEALQLLFVVINGNVVGVLGRYVARVVATYWRVLDLSLLPHPEVTGLSFHFSSQL